MHADLSVHMTFHLDCDFCKDTVKGASSDHTSPAFSRLAKAHWSEDSDRLDRAQRGPVQ